MGRRSWYRINQALREMVLHVTNEGDFQDCYIVVERTRQTLTRSVTHTRRMDIRSFPSVADWTLRRIGRELTVFISDGEYA
jgi:hypothetical protein